MNKLFNMRNVLDLQYFAGALNVQTTTLAVAGTNDLSAEMKTYYDKNIIRNAVPNLVHDQFGQKRPIPKNGGKIIEFRKYSPLPKAMTELTEGVTPDGNKLNVSTITSTIKQYGDYITLSDVIMLTAIDHNLVEAGILLGNQAGETLDRVTALVLNAGTNVQYGDGTYVSRATMITGNAKLNVLSIKKAVRTLKRNKAKKIKGYYVAIIHPDVAFDLTNDSEWIEASKYAGSEQIFEGEIGKIHGVRFVETTEAVTFADTKTVYSTLVLGENAYGVTEVEGGGLQNIIKQLGSAGTADPLNQRATSGWKAMKTAEILVQEYMVRIETIATA